MINNSVNTAVKNNTTSDQYWSMPGLTNKKESLISPSFCFSVAYFCPGVNNMTSHFYPLKVSVNVYCRSFDE